MPRVSCKRCLAEGEVCNLPLRRAHLNWCKARALEELEQGGPFAIMNAWASFVSDMGKETETADHMGLRLGLLEMMLGRLSTKAEMRHHILGYN